MAQQDKGIVPVTDYAIMQASPEAVLDTIAANVGTIGVTEFDLDRIKVPAGGALRWEVPGLEGPEYLEAIEGVIIHHKAPRAYWKTAYSGGGAPPDCYSDDGIIGHGDNGTEGDVHECAKCPLAQFGSADNGRGQACRQMRLLFMVRPSSLLPVVVVAPPTSVRNIQRYMLRLAGQNKPYWSVVTRLKLERAKSNAGHDYSRIVPEVAAVLDEETAARMAQYSKAIRPYLERLQVTSDDVDME